MKSLDINKLKKRKISDITTEESLKDIIPFDFDEDVLSGEKQVTFGD